MENSFLPVIDSGGLTTAVNGTAGATSSAVAVKGPAVMVAVGIAASAYIRFGRANSTAVTAVNGFLLSQGTTAIFSVPQGATHILCLRHAATDTEISVINGVAGT